MDQGHPGVGRAHRIQFCALGIDAPMLRLKSVHAKLNLLRETDLCIACTDRCAVHFLPGKGTPSDNNKTHTAQRVGHEGQLCPQMGKYDIVTLIHWSGH